MSPSAASQIGTEQGPAFSRMIGPAMICALLVYLAPTDGGAWLLEWVRGGTEFEGIERLWIVLSTLLVGISGGVFCLFPGWVLSNRRLMLIGFACGFIADAAINLASRAWGPRVNPTELPYSGALETLIPPALHTVWMRPAGPSADLQWVLTTSHALWMTVMLAIWLMTWRPKLPPVTALAVIIVAASVSSGLAWVLAGALPYQPRGLGAVEPGWPIAPLLALAIAAVPLGAAAAALMIRLGTGPAGRPGSRASAPHADLASSPEP